MVTLTKKERFDDEGPKTSDGSVEWAYHGYECDVSVGDESFRVRLYDDEPGVATVVTRVPTDVQRRARVRALVDYLAREFGCTSFQFFAPNGGFGAVDMQTLDYIQ